MTTINELLEFKIDRPKLIVEPKELTTTNEDILMVYNTLNNLGVNLGYFLENASSIEFEQDKKLSNKFRSSAYYDAFGNIIKTSPNNYKNTITHELLHMASTTIEGTKAYVGFQQFDALNKVLIGEALNEGYTAMLDARLFGELIPGKMEEEKKLYPLTKRITDFLELTLGKELMTKAYFEADLKTIVSYLSKLMGKKKTIRFLYEFDDLFESSDGIQKINIKNMCNYYPDMQLYTAEAFYTKITDKYRNGTLTESEYKEFLTLVKYILYSRMTILKLPVTKDLKETLPYIEERYEEKYKIRQKNNCLVK